MHCVFRVVTASVFLFVVGCSSDGKGPKLGYVTGKVTLDGEPLVGASVRIQPENGAPAMGLVGKDGKYEMIYKTDKPGAPVGTSQIFVALAYPEPELDYDMDPAKAAVLREKAAAKTGIPKKWRDGSNTITVAPGSNTFNIELIKESSGEQKK